MKTDLNLGRTKKGNRFTWFGEDRATHMQVVGSSGKGKSKFLENLLRQDISNPEKPGVLLIDPHGSLYDDLVAYCSYHEIDKFRNIHLFNPSADNSLMGFNPLQPDPFNDPSVQVDAMVEACAQVWGEKDPMKTPLLRKTLKVVFFSLLEKGYTLVEASDLVTGNDPHGVRQFLSTGLSNPVYQNVWNDFNSMNERDFRDSFSSTNNRLVEFLGAPRVRNIVGQQYCSIDFRRVIEDGDIVLCNLAKSPKLSRDNGRVLGALILNNVFLTALAREAASPHPQPYYVYIDECYRFITSDIESMLDETRKFGVHLVLSHQRMGQLRDMGEGILNAVQDGAQTKVIFGGINTKDSQEIASDIFLGELDLEQGVEATMNPMVVGQVVDWLDNESHTEGKSDSESATESHGSTMSEGISFGEGSSLSDDADAAAISSESFSETSGHSETDGYSTSRASSRSESATSGRSQTMKSVYEDRYSSVHGLDKILFAAADRIKNQPKRTAIVKVPGAKTEHISVDYVETPVITETYVQDYHDRILEHSPYSTPMALANQEIEKRTLKLIKLADGDDSDNDPGY